MDSSIFVFEIFDWKQRKVRLNRKTYEIHCNYRPETPLYLPEAQQVISDPDVVLLNDKGATLLYRFGLGKSQFSNLYLQVVVYYESKNNSPEIGKVATYFFTDEIDTDCKIIEHRAQYLMGQRFNYKETNGNK